MTYHFRMIMAMQPMRSVITTMLPTMLPFQQLQQRQASISAQLLESVLDLHSLPYLLLWRRLQLPMLLLPLLLLCLLRLVTAGYPALKARLQCRRAAYLQEAA